MRSGLANAYARALFWGIDAETLAVLGCPYTSLTRWERSRSDAGEGSAMRHAHPALCADLSHEVGEVYDDAAAR
jgi:hypothetical protein